jgi:hypothetical protein
MQDSGCSTRLGISLHSKTNWIFSIAIRLIARWAAIVSTGATRYQLFCFLCNSGIQANVDNQTVNTSLTVPRPDGNFTLPVAPEIVFQAVFVWVDKHSQKKGIFSSWKKDFKEVQDLANGGTKVVVAPAKMKKRYVEVTLLNDALIVSKVNNRSPKERQLLFPPIPLTEATAALSGHNNAVDVVLSAHNAIRLVELEAGQKDKFLRLFSRRKGYMAEYEGIAIAYLVSR